jgi:hypothetical protein
LNIEAKQVLELIVRPTLKAVCMHSVSAERLLVYTGVVESDFDFLKQNPGGPALGWWQMEPIAYKQNCSYLKRHPNMYRRALATCFLEILPPFETLIWNLRLACIMARIQYWQREEPLPSEDDLEGMANYYVKYYNCGGAATVEGFMKKCKGLF